uniref:HAT C-terminal dimerisation domain-containing protein n=1 Tax=Amphimedon queenslandica TaxID=400682 RepID=A0A1X7TWU2_AMPQE
MKRTVSTRSDLDDSEEASRSSTSASKRWSGAAIYKTKFQESWIKKWPFVQPVKTNIHQFYCTTCSKNISCGHQGEADIVRHSSSEQHKSNAKSLRANTKLNFQPITRAEVKVTNLLVQHNVPLAVTDHLSPLFREIFTDSKIAKGYASAPPHFKATLVDTMRCSPFSVAIDGSNDNGLEKMNPLTVRFFDEGSGLVVTNLLDMCLTTGKAESIFTKMNEVFTNNGVSWDHCIGAGVDNTSVNLGVRNSIRTRVLQKNPNTYFMGCPCHIVHNTALKASSKFAELTKFDVEDLLVDNYFYFDKSTERKNGLAEFCTFCDSQYKEETNNRFQRLRQLYTNPMTEVYLYFYQACLQPFVHLNTLLQRNDPIIGIVANQLIKFLKTLLGKFVCVRSIKEADHLTTVSYTTRENQLDDNALHIGFSTRSLLRKLLDEGDISPQQVNNFYRAVRNFYEEATSYSIANLPLHDEVLECAKFVTFDARETALFSQVEFFVQRYPNLLPFTSPSEMTLLSEEFTSFQLLDREDVPKKVWESAVITMDNETNICQHRMDLIWAYLGSVKSLDGTFLYGRLAKVAQLVLVIPHSNAEEERVFSLITKNKTSFRPSLMLDGTLSSIIQVKLANPEPCFKYEPTKEVIKTAKKATMTYNRAHTSGASQSESM